MVAAFAALYTTHLTQKRKVWLDGSCRYSAKANKVRLFDDDGRLITESFWARRGPPAPGITVQIDRLLVQIEERLDSAGKDGPSSAGTDGLEGLPSRSGEDCDAGSIAASITGSVRANSAGTDSIAAAAVAANRAARAATMRHRRVNLGRPLNELLKDESMEIKPLDTFALHRQARKRFRVESSAEELERPALDGTSRVQLPLPAAQLAVPSSPELEMDTTLAPEPDAKLHAPGHKGQFSIADARHTNAGHANADVGHANVEDAGCRGLATMPVARRSDESDAIDTNANVNANASVDKVAHAMNVAPMVRTGANVGASTSALVFTNPSTGVNTSSAGDTSASMRADLNPGPDPAADDEDDELWSDVEILDVTTTPRPRRSLFEDVPDELPNEGPWTKEAYLLFSWHPPVVKEEEPL